MPLLISQMAAPSTLSNFGEFQKVLQQSSSRLRVAGDGQTPIVTFSSPGVAKGSSRSVTEEDSDDFNSDAHSESSNVGSERPMLAFARRTQTWSRKPNSTGQSTDLALTSLLEEPNKTWTQWTALTTESAAGIVHRRVFDVSGRKTTDELKFWPNHPVLGFLESLYYALRKRNIKPLSQDWVISEDKYKWLFFAKGSILRQRDANWNGPDHTAVADASSGLVRFINDTFQEANHAQGEMRQSGLALYEHLWALYPPQELVYEKRLIPPRNTPYEQCSRIRAVEEFISFTDRGRTLRLVVEEVVYGRGSLPGPRLITSCRYIRQYAGSKPITADALGLVPLSMLPEQEQKAIRARLIERGHRYIDICAMPFSIMDYDGPFCLLHPQAIENTKEEMILSSTERAVQKYTTERVVVDTTAFRRNHSHYHDRDHIHDSDAQIPDSNVYEPLDTEDTPAQLNESVNEELHLICRGHIPAYLISSRVQAIGIIVSRLQPPSWRSSICISSALGSAPRVDLGLWTTLIGDFLTEEGGRDAKYQRRRVRGSGLVLLLQGPKRTTNAIPRYITEALHKPLVTLPTDEKIAWYHDKSKDALRWGGMLLIEQREDLMEKEALEELPSAFVFYPGVIFLAVNDASTLSERYLDTVDAVINCEGTLSSINDHPQAALWRQYLADELPSVVKELPGENLDKLCSLLAEFEPREGRMPKILLTAERLAQSRGCRVGVEHVLTVVRQSVGPGDVGTFDAALAAGKFRLGM